MLWSRPTRQRLFILGLSGRYLVVCPTAQGVAARDQKHAIALAVLDTAGTTVSDDGGNVLPVTVKV